MSRGDFGERQHSFYSLEFEKKILKLADKFDRIFLKGNPH
jgi:hypothetical protein